MNATHTRNGFPTRSVTTWSLAVVFVASLWTSGLLQAATSTNEAAKPDPVSWPPEMPGAVNGTVTITSPDFFPQNASKTMPTGSVSFVMAKTPPPIDLAYHRDLPNAALNGTGWSAWGDICLASDGKVYCGVGDHGKDVEGEGHVYVYRWDPSSKVLEQIVDANKLADVQRGDPSFSKVHARILEGKDRNIYFTCTLNDGGRAGKVAWTKRIPGGLIYQHDPTTGKTTIIGHMDGTVTATTLMDREHNLLYCCLEERATNNPPHWPRTN